LPVVAQLAAEYGDRVDFVAPAWKADFAATEKRAHELFPADTVKWGLDEPDETVFGLYGVPYQPMTVLIGSDGSIVDEWLGVRDEEALRRSLDNLVGRDG
jgi:hypothetical protein